MAMNSLFVGFSLDVRHRVAEKPLQHLDVAPVPGDLDVNEGGDPFRVRQDALKRTVAAVRGSFPLPIFSADHWSRVPLKMTELSLEQP